MSNEIETKPATADLLTALASRITAREKEIDEVCNNAVRMGLHAIQLAFQQGDDLLDAKENMPHGQWLPWLEANFPKDHSLAARYMRLAKVPKLERSPILQDAKSVNEAFRMLGIIAPEPARLNEGEARISLPPEIQKLNWIAEWCAREQPTFEEMTPLARGELKTRLEPIVQLYAKL
jgi:hypothetical protein